MYDIIGDIHGQAEELKTLLTKLGYSERVAGTYEHSERKVIFLGDFIDRGPSNLEVCGIAQSMIESGSALAIMGNHEFNAIGFYNQLQGDEESNYQGVYMRPRTNKNLKQHLSFLSEVFSKPKFEKEYERLIKFFKSLPVFIEDDGIQIVHAAWHQPTIENIKPFLDEKYCIKEEVYAEAFRKESNLYKSFELLLKGPEVKLPERAHFFDKDGNKRTEVRLKWWADPPFYYSHHSIGAPNIQEFPGDLESTRIIGEDVDGYERSEDAPILFFGHYWLNGLPMKQTDKHACLDYSVAKPGGQLVAYRWSGEATLKNENFISVSRLD